MHAPFNSADEVVRLEPRNVKGHTRRGTALLAMGSGRAEEAAAAFHNALKVGKRIHVKASSFTPSSVAQAKMNHGVCVCVCVCSGGGGGGEKESGQLLLCIKAVGVLFPCTFDSPALLYRHSKTKMPSALLLNVCYVYCFFLHF